MHYSSRYTGKIPHLGKLRQPIPLCCWCLQRHKGYSRCSNSESCFPIHTIQKSSQSSALRRMQFLPWPAGGKAREVDYAKERSRLTTLVIADKRNRFLFQVPGLWLLTRGGMSQPQQETPHGCCLSQKCGKVEENRASDWITRLRGGFLCVEFGKKRLKACQLDSLEERPYQEEFRRQLNGVLSSIGRILIRLQRHFSKYPRKVAYFGKLDGITGAGYSGGGHQAVDDARIEAKDKLNCWYDWHDWLEMQTGRGQAAYIADANLPLVNMPVLERRLQSGRAWQQSDPLAHLLHEGGTIFLSPTSRHATVLAKSLRSREVEINKAEHDLFVDRI